MRPFGEDMSWSSLKLVITSHANGKPNTIEPIMSAMCATKILVIPRPLAARAPTAIKIIAARARSASAMATLRFIGIAPVIIFAPSPLRLKNQKKTRPRMIANIACLTQTPKRSA